MDYKSFEGENRSAIAIQFQINGTSIWHVNTHMTLNATSRALEAIELKHFIDSIASARKGMTTPVIVTGDFNAGPNEQASQTMRSGYIDAWYSYSKKLSFGYTFPALKPDRRIDYVYFKEQSAHQFNVTSFEIQETTASDHRPVFLTVKIDV